MLYYIFVFNIVTKNQKEKNIYRIITVILSIPSKIHELFPLCNIIV